jgi:hypothetical protein
MISLPASEHVRERGNAVSDAQPSEGFQKGALARARCSEKGRPGVLAWLAGLSIHAALVVLLVI